MKKIKGSLSIALLTLMVTLSSCGNRDQKLETALNEIKELQLENEAQATEIDMLLNMLHAFDYSSVPEEYQAQIQELYTKIMTLEEHNVALRASLQKDYQLSELQLMAYNPGDGTVKYCFVEANSLIDKWQTVPADESENGPYMANTTVYVSVTNPDLTFTAEDRLYRQEDGTYTHYSTMPSFGLLQDASYVPDYKVPHLITNFKISDLPENLSYREVYTIDRLKAIEEELNNGPHNLFTKKQKDYFYLSNLVLIKYQDHYFFIDLDNYVDISYENKVILEQDTIRYYPSVTNREEGLKCHYDVLHQLRPYTLQDAALDFTSLDQAYASSFGPFNKDNLEVIRDLSPYITLDRAIYTITEEELASILAELNKDDTKTLELK